MASGQLNELIPQRFIPQDASFHNVSGIEGQELYVPPFSVKACKESDAIVASRILAHRPWCQAVNLILGYLPATLCSANETILALSDYNAYRNYQTQFGGFPPDSEQKTLKVVNNILNGFYGYQINNIWKGPWYSIDTDVPNVVRKGKGSHFFNIGFGTVYTPSTQGLTPNGNNCAALLSRAKLEDSLLTANIPIDKLRGTCKGSVLYPIRNALLIAAGKKSWQANCNEVEIDSREICTVVRKEFGTTHKSDISQSLNHLCATGTLNRITQGESRLRLAPELGHMYYELQKAIIHYRTLVNTGNGNDELVEAFGQTLLTTDQSNLRFSSAVNGLAKLYQGPTNSRFY